MRANWASACGKRCLVPGGPGGPRDARIGAAMRIREHCYRGTGCPRELAATVGEFLGELVIWQRRQDAMPNRVEADRHASVDERADIPGVHLGRVGDVRCVKAIGEARPLAAGGQLGWRFRGEAQHPANVRQPNLGDALFEGDPPVWAQPMHRTPRQKKRCGDVKRAQQRKRDACVAGVVVVEAHREPYASARVARAVSQLGQRDDVAELAKRLDLAPNER